MVAVALAFVGGDRLARGLTLGTLEADMRVTETDTGLAAMKVQGRDGRPSCDPADATDTGGTAPTWPYTAAEVARVYGDPTARDAGIWALPSADDLRDIAVGEQGQDMLIVDVNTQRRWIDRDGSDAARTSGCAWFGLAAIDDVLDDWNATHTDAAAEVGALFRTGGAEARWPCTYLPFVKRLREEAAVHPDVLTTVVLDEADLIVDGPDTVLHDHWQPQGAGVCETEPWRCQGAHWAPSNIADLAGMVIDGTDLGPALQADAFGRTESDYTKPVCDTHVLPLGGSALDLWARVTDVGAARHVVPAAVLGMPALPAKDPASAPSSTQDRYRFEAGDGAAVSFEVDAPSSGLLGAHPNWKAEVEFLYATGWSDPAEPLDFSVKVNGTRIDDGSLLATLDSEQVRRAAPCAGGTSCTASAWDSTTGATNTIALKLQATDTTSLDLDRTLYAWALRVRYVDTGTDQAFWSSDASGAALPGPTDMGSYTTLGSPGSEVLALINAPWRFEDEVNGVVFAHDISADVDGDFDGDAWDRFLAHACAHLHATQGPGDAPVSCLVDERAQVFDYDDVTAFDLDNLAVRLRAGFDRTDGVLATSLPLGLANLSTGMGRFTDRPPFDASADAMVVEPAQQHSILGETHEYVATVPPGCGGDYTVTATVYAEAAEPLLWFYAYVDPTDRKFDQYVSQAIDDDPDGARPWESTYSDTIQDVAAGDTLTLGWSNDGGGSSVFFASAVQFEAHHATDPACDLDRPSWSPVNSMDSQACSMQLVYDCIVEAFGDPAGFAACSTTSCP